MEKKPFYSLKIYVAGAEKWKITIFRP